MVMQFSSIYYIERITLHVLRLHVDVDIRLTSVFFRPVII